MTVNLPNIGLFWGDDYLIGEKIKALKAKISPSGGWEAFNFLQIDLAEQPLETLIQETLSLPMATGPKIIIIKNLSLDKNEYQKSIADYIRLKEIFLKEKPEVHLFFIFPGAKKRDLDDFPLYQLALDQQGLFDLAGFYQNESTELKDWLAAKINQAGKQIDEPALEKLIEISSLDLRNLASEIEKLITYAGEEKKITLAAVELLVSERTKEIFSLLEAILAASPQQALPHLRNLLKEGEAPHFIIQFLGRQYHLFLEIAALSKEGFRKEEIINYLTKEQKYNYYFVKKSCERAPRLSIDDLINAIELLHRLDIALKTSARDPKISLELLIWELSQ